MFESTTNICEKKKQIDMVAVTLGQLAVPPYCPVNSEMIFCYDNKKILTMSASNQKILSGSFVIARETVKRVEITHDNGKSCFEALIKVIKI